MNSESNLPKLARLNSESQELSEATQDRPEKPVTISQELRRVPGYRAKGSGQTEKCLFDNTYRTLVRTEAMVLELDRPPSPPHASRAGFIRSAVALHVPMVAHVA